VGFLVSSDVALGVGVCTARNDQRVSYWRVTLAWGRSAPLIRARLKRELGTSYMHVGCFVLDCGVIFVPPVRLESPDEPYVPILLSE